MYPLIVITRAEYPRNVRQHLEIREEIFMKRHNQESIKPRHPNWWRKYGITAEDGNILLERQGRGCLICEDWWGDEALVKLVVDHYHRPGATRIAVNDVRGLLCATCNSGLGKFADDIPRMVTAINFLAHYRRRGFAWNGGDACYICRDYKAKLHPYKDEQTGNWNGHLCYECLMGLGLFKHSQWNLRRAVAYLLYWDRSPAGAYWRDPDFKPFPHGVPEELIGGNWEDTPWFKPDSGFPAFWSHRHNCFEHKVY